MFQSSPVPEDGCNFPVAQFCGLKDASFNPHPSRRTGATNEHLREYGSLGVSILTRPGGRVQLTLVHLPVRCGCFNPHPSRRTGATAASPAQPAAERVSILTRPGGRVQRTGRAMDCCWLVVSILTRPGGRVQPSTHHHGKAAGIQFQSSPVPEDGCNLPTPHNARLDAERFNPHPSRRTGATV